MNEYNDWRRERGLSPLPPHVRGEKDVAKKHVVVCVDAWEGLREIAEELGYRLGDTNRGNISQFLEALGHGLLVVNLPK